MIIHNISGLEALHSGSVIVDADGNVYEKDTYQYDPNLWWAPGSELPYHASDIQLPAKLIHQPDQEETA